MSANFDPVSAMQQFMQFSSTFNGFKPADSGTVVPGMAHEAIAVLMQKTSSISSEWMASHARLWESMLQSSSGQGAGGNVAEPPVSDKRFADEAWSKSVIHDYWRRAYLLNAEYLQKLADEVPIADPRERVRFDFLVRQYIDSISPANFAVTNPEFVGKAIETQGESIQRAIQNLIRDVEKGGITTTDTSAFQVGRNLATTPGKVVFENELFQLLQYAPLTAKVAQRPLLMVPPCINKYYILDLQEHNSLVRHGVEQGNTVFMVSWRNPGEAQAGLTWDDYIDDGVLKALAVAAEIGKVDAVNVLGFCVGGTMLTTALAVAAARGEKPAHSLTLLTTLLDFSGPGDLGFFINEALVSAKETHIGERGILPGREMAGVFSSLRANDMIWQYVVKNYLKGEDPTAFDLLYWNADSTNQCGPFLVWYLRNMYLENNLCVPGKLQVCGVSVDLGSIDVPTFVFAAREDHIVPWESAYRSAQLLKGEVTFVLGASGHVAGVVNPARANKRSYWQGQGVTATSERWFAEANEIKGSWWNCWSEWLQAQGGKPVAARKQLGNASHKPLADAPGSYVLEKS